MPSDFINEQQQSEFENVISEALDGTPRAAVLKQMKSVLIDRRAMLYAALKEEENSDKREQLKKRLEELDEQIKILSEEATINQFIEDTARFSQEVRKMQN